jgi:hypothetical protein
MVHWIWVLIVASLALSAGYVVRALMEGLSCDYPDIPESDQPYRPSKNVTLVPPPGAKGDE